MTDETQEKQTLEQKLVSKGVGKEKIQQKLYEIATLSLEPIQALKASKLLKTEFEEETLQKIYAILRERKCEEKLDSAYVRPVSEFFKESGILPNYAPKEISDLVLVDAIPFNRVSEKTAKLDIEFFEKYIGSNILNGWQSNEKKDTLKEISQKFPNEYSLVRDRLVEEGVKTSEIGRLERIKEYFAEVDFQKYTDQIQTKLLELFQNGDSNNFKRLAEVTGIKVKDHPIIQAKYEERIKSACKEWNSLGYVGNLSEMTGIPIKRTESLEKIIHEEVIPTALSWNTENIEYLKKLGFAPSKGDLGTANDSLIRKRLENNDFKKKYQGKNNLGFDIDSQLRNLKNFDITISPETVEAIKSQVYRLNPQKAEEVSEIAGFKVDEETFQSSINEQLKDGNIDLAIGWTEYYCIKPNIAKEKIDEIAKIAIAKSKNTSYNQLEHLKKASDLAELAEVKINFDETEVQDLYRSAKNVSPAKIKKIIGINYSIETEEALQNRIKDDLINSDHPVYDHTVLQIEEYLGVKIKPQTLNNVYRTQLNQGKFGDVRYSINECSKKDQRLTLGLEELIDWIKSPTRDEITEERNARIERENQYRLERQAEMERRERIPKYSVQQSAVKVKVDITIPINSDNKFVYAVTDNGTELLYARPLYECGYHREIASIMQESHPKLKNISGGYMKAYQDGVELHGSSESFGTAPMQRVKELIEKAGGKAK